LGSKGTAPRILYLGIRWGVVSFTLQPLYPQRPPGTLWIGGSRAGLDSVMKGKFPSLFRHSNPRPSSP